jgi:fermentation-respiration switch protein FrsA (DUF1100 family)
MLNNLGDVMKARKIVLFTGSIFLPVLLNTAEPNFIIQYCTDSNCPREKIGYFFAHGLGATQEQGLFFSATNKWILNKPLVLFDFPDAKNNNMEYYADKVNLGQELDIQRLEWSFKQAINELPDYKLVLAGISRGAATIINFLALNQPQPIAALILESPFDTLRSIIKHLLRRFHVNWIPFSKRLAYKIAKKNFPLLNLDGIFPIHVIQKIPTSIPIFIVHSKRDKVIPINSSRQLYKALLLAGHTDVYILELASGEHGKLAQGLEGELYRNVVHAFYKKYHLPHNPSWAQAGEIMLLYCQPTLEEIIKRIRKKRSSYEIIFEDDEDEFENNNWNTDYQPKRDLIKEPSYYLEFKLLVQT